MCYGLLYKWVVFSFIVYVRERGLLQGRYRYILVYGLSKMFMLQSLDIKVMGLSGEVGIIVIGSLSTWLTHRGFMQVFNGENWMGCILIIISNYRERISLMIILTSLSMLLVVLAIPVIALDENMHMQLRAYAPSLISFSLELPLMG